MGASLDLIRALTVQPKNEGVDAVTTQLVAVDRARRGGRRRLGIRMAGASAAIRFCRSRDVRKSRKFAGICSILLFSCSIFPKHAGFSKKTKGHMRVFGSLAGTLPLYGPYKLLVADAQGADG